jgi:hypothetical protein
MSENPPEEPKLIIDEDWKTQVQREKEELKKREAEASQETPVAEGQEDTGEATSAESSDSPPPPPPASLLLLVTTLATQAMAALGQLPDEEGKSMPVNLDYARHFIDSIGVLEEKTKGNLTSEEETYVQQTLHQLRLAFVTIRNQSSGG